MKMRFTYEITDNKTGKKTRIQVDDAKGYQFNASKKMEELIALAYDGDASLQLVGKERLD